MKDPSRPQGGSKDISRSLQYRYRYIAFVIKSVSPEPIHITRKDMIYCLQRKCISMYGAPCNTYGIFLTRFKDDKGIVKCFHIEKIRTIELLSSISMIKDTSVQIKTLGTSGTMKALIRKHIDGDTLQE